MKKFFGLALVLFFVFSLLPVTVATAGPAYENLKKSGKFFTRLKLDKGPVTGKVYGQLKEIVRTMIKKGDTKATLVVGSQYTLVVTKAEHIFSNESFQKVLKVKRVEELFCKKLSKILSSMVFLRDGYLVFYSAIMNRIFDAIESDLLNKKIESADVFYIKSKVMLLFLDNLIDKRKKLSNF